MGAIHSSTSYEDADGPSRCQKAPQMPSFHTISINRQHKIKKVRLKTSLEQDFRDLWSGLKEAHYKYQTSCWKQWRLYSCKFICSIQWENCHRESWRMRCFPVELRGFAGLGISVRAINNSRAVPERASESTSWRLQTTLSTIRFDVLKTWNDQRYLYKVPTIVPFTFVKGSVISL